MTAPRSDILTTDEAADMRRAWGEDSQFAPQIDACADWVERADLSAKEGESK